MTLVLIVLLLLAMPGFVVVRWLCREDLECGLPGAFGLSTLAALAVLSIPSILCYLLGAPIWILSAVVVLLVLAAPIEISRRHWWPDIGRLLLTGFCLEMIIVIGDMVLSGSIGMNLTGDSAVHLSRIRSLINHGFNNVDPFVGEDHFFPIYHTNLLHAIFAVASNICQVDPIEAWFIGLSWVKLLIASGFYFAGWCVFRTRGAAWAVAMFAVAVEGPVPFLLYPNKISPFVFIPFMIGFAAQATDRQLRWIACLKLTAGSLILGQIHGLYATFAALSLTPVLVCLFAVRSFIDTKGGMEAGVRKRQLMIRSCCVLGVLVGLFFPLASKLGTVTTAGGIRPAKKTTPKKSRYLYFLEDDQVIRKPGGGFGSGHKWRFKLLALGGICAILSNQRRRALVPIAAAATTAFIFFTPTVCTIVYRLIGKDWALARMEVLFRICLYVLLPGAIVYLLGRLIAEDSLAARWPRQQRLANWWSKARVIPVLSRGSASVLVFWLGVHYSHHKDPKKKYTWDKVFAKADEPDAKRLLMFNHLMRVNAFLSERLPAGQTILADESLGMSLVSVYDCRVIAAKRGSIGVSDLKERRADLRRIFSQRTAWDEKSRLLQKYDVEYYVPSQGAKLKWLEGHVVRRWHLKGGILLYKLKR